MTRRRPRPRLLSDKGRDLVAVLLIGLAMGLTVAWAAADPGPQRLPPHYSLRGHG